MAAKVELWLKLDDTYESALSIPVDACQRFSTRPLAWLRYLAFTIFGSEGHISTTLDGEVVNYSHGIHSGNYYYVPQEGSGTFLLDPDLMDDRTSIRSTRSIRRNDFKTRVTRRDGSCVMTDTETVQACHIVPHSKGDQYMINLASHRHGEAIDPPLVGINDVRNGILLAHQLHETFGHSLVAFLRTPNFAMTINDVDRVIQPRPPGSAIQPSLANRRLTIQHFNNRDHVTAIVAPHNSDARISDSVDWPPPLIFDTAYGCAALKTWGVPQFLAFARERTRDIYYDSGDDDDDENGEDGDDDENGDGGDDNENGDGSGGNDGGGDDKNGGNGDGGGQQKLERAARAARREKRRRGSQASNATISPAHETIRAQQMLPDHADMLLALWMNTARKGRCQARAMKADRTREKVRTWLDSAE